MNGGHYTQLYNQSQAMVAMYPYHHAGPMGLPAHSYSGPMTTTVPAILSKPIKTTPTPGKY